MLEQLPIRQKTVMLLLQEMAVNDTVKLTNSMIAKELFTRKKMSGFNNKPVDVSAVSRYLRELKDKDFIRLEEGATNHDRIIHLLKKIDEKVGEK